MRLFLHKLFARGHVGPPLIHKRFYRLNVTAPSMVHTVLSVRPLRADPVGTIMASESMSAVAELAISHCETSKQVFT